MTSLSKTTDAIELLALSRENLRGFRFDAETTEELLTLASLATLRRNLGYDRPIFVGFIGCTGTGKSTLFNSLAGTQISATGWRAHNTRGPVVSMRHSHHLSIQDLESRFGPLLFPFLHRRIQHAKSSESTAGSALHATIVVNDGPEDRITLVDLPDINTTLAGEERLLALRLQPWLDTVVFVVDDETLYHRDYEKPVAIAAQFGLTCLCVLNNRGRDRVDLNHPDLKNTRTFFNAASFHVLPDLRGKERFTNELTFVEFKERLRDTARQAPDMPLLQRIGSLSERLLAENQERHEAFQNLEKDVAATVQGLIKQDPDVPLDRILHDDVLAVLSHLGLKRFTVSNIYHFLKRSATTRSVKRSFRLAFGNRRDDGLSQVLRLDVDKLTELIHQRLTDYGDVIAGAIRHHPGAGRILRAAPQLRTIRLGTEEESLNGSLKEIATAFEEECRELVRSDSVSSSVKNDPFVAVAVLIAIGVDCFAIPYFGSWLIVPTVMKYLPVGEFAAVKKRFQKKIHDLTRAKLLDAARSVRDARGTHVLEEDDSMYTVLRRCAEHKENET